MNKRERNLLNYLLDSPYYVPIDEYTKLLHCSEKTIRNDLKKIDFFLEENHLNVKLLRQRGKGIYLSATEKEKANLRRLIHVNQLDIEPNIYRICRGIDIFLNRATPIIIEKLSEELFTNQKIIQQEIVVWESMLPKFHLTLSRKNGLLLVGREENIRLFAMFYLYRMAFSAMSEKMEDSMILTNKHFFQEILRDVELLENQKFTNNAFNQLILYLDMMVKRIKIAQYIEMETKDSIRKSVSIIGKKMSQHFCIEIPKSELLFLDKMLYSSTKQEELNSLHQLSTSPLSKRLIQHLVQLLEQEFALKMDMEIIKVLENSLDIALIRAENHILVLNIVGNETKYEFLEAYLCLLYLFTDDSLLKQYRIYDMDFARLAMIIQPKFNDRNEQLEKLKGAMIVNNGIEQAYYGKTQLHKYFNDIDICYTISSSSIKEIESKIDFFVTFEYIQSETPFIVVSNMIKNEDLLNFHVFLDNLQRERKDQQLLEFQDISYNFPTMRKPKFEKIIKIFAEIVVENGWVMVQSQALFQEFLRNFFIYEKKVVIPYFSECVTQTKVYCYTSNTTLYVEGNIVDSIYILLISTDEKEQLPNIVSEIHNKLNLGKKISYKE